MSDEDEGNADFTLDFLELQLHLFSQVLIQRRQRFIKQKHARFIDKRTGDCDTLLLAAGHAGDITVFESLKTDQGNHTHDLLVNDVLGLFLDLETECDVVIDIQMRKQCIVLEYGIDVTLVRRNLCDILTVHHDLTFGRIQESGNDPKQRCLAAAGRTKQGDKLVLIDVERDALQDDCVVKCLDDVFYFNQFFHSAVPPLIRKSAVC